MVKWVKIVKTEITIEIQSDGRLQRVVTINYEKYMNTSIIVQCPCFRSPKLLFVFVSSILAIA